MDDTNIFGNTLNQLGQAAKQTATDAVKQIVKLPEEMASDAGEQIGGSKPPASTENSKQPKQQSEWQSDEERVKFLRGLYGVSEEKPPENKNTEKKSEANNTSANPFVKAEEKKNTTSANPFVKVQEKPSEFQEQIADKTPEEQKKLMELRSQLHKDVYYDPTFNPVKKQEERPAEKVENEKKQEMQELQKKEEDKPQPMAVVMGQNKAERFPGASG
jgi:hypothetical protein